jgi:hypothetical protein
MRAPPATAPERATRQRYASGVSPTWIWMQAAIVVCVLAGAAIAIVKLV